MTLKVQGLSLASGNAGTVVLDSKPMRPWHFIAAFLGALAGAVPAIFVVFVGMVVATTSGTGIPGWTWDKAYAVMIGLVVGGGAIGLGLALYVDWLHKAPNPSSPLLDGLRRSAARMAGPGNSRPPPKQP
jgi:hypothetical protein